MQHKEKAFLAPAQQEGTLPPLDKLRPLFVAKFGREPTLEECHIYGLFEQSEAYGHFVKSEEFAKLRTEAFENARKLIQIIGETCFKSGNSLYAVQSLSRMIDTIVIEARNLRDMP